MDRMRYVLVVILICCTVMAGLKVYRDIGNHDHAVADKCVMLGLPDLIEQAKLSTVHVRVNNQWQGSGVIIDEHTVLTAGHVVDGADSIEIMLSNGYFLRSESFYKDPNNDCGIIKFKENFLPLRIAELGDSNSITVGLSVIAIGSPYGDRFFNTASFGIVSGLNRDMGYYNWNGVITLNLLADPGYSGGPIFNMDGEVIGILVGTYSRYGNATVMTPVDVCKEMLKNDKADKPERTNSSFGVYK